MTHGTPQPRHGGMTMRTCAEESRSFSGLVYYTASARGPEKSKPPNLGIWAVSDDSGFSDPDAYGVYSGSAECALILPPAWQMDLFIAAYQSRGGATGHWARQTASPGEVGYFSARASSS